MVVYYDFETYFRDTVHIPVSVSYAISTCFNHLESFHLKTANSESDNVGKSFIKYLIETYYKWWLYLW